MHIEAVEDSQDKHHRHDELAGPPEEADKVFKGMPQEVPRTRQVIRRQLHNEVCRSAAEERPLEYEPDERAQDDADEVQR